MKKITVFILSILATASTAFALSLHSANDDKPITYDQLPAAAKEFIKDNFGKEQVSRTTLDSDLIGDEYTVVFTSGIKLEFCGDGNWKEVDCRYSEVPHSLIPGKIVDYLKANYADSKVREIKRERGGYEVKLNNGLELTFDRDYRLVEIDD